MMGERKRRQACIAVAAATCTCRRAQRAQPRMFKLKAHVQLQRRWATAQTLTYARAGSFAGACSGPGSVPGAWRGWPLTALKIPLNSDGGSRCNGIALEGRVQGVHGPRAKHRAIGQELFCLGGQRSRVDNFWCELGQSTPLYSWALKQRGGHQRVAGRGRSCSGNSVSESCCMANITIRAQTARRWLSTVKFSSTRGIAYYAGSSFASS